MAIGITQYVNRNLSITDNVNDRNLVIDVISNASDFVTPFTLFHPLYKMNALERNLLTAAGATDDIFECLARMDLNLTSGLEYNLLAALIEEYGLTPEDIIIAGIGTGAWWHDASDMYQDNAGLTPATANLAPVGRWDDLSGNGHHVVQSSLAAKPRINTGALNGYRGVNFDGSDILATVGNMSISTFAIWVVARETANVESVVVEHGPNANTNNGHYLLNKPSAGLVAKIRRSATDSTINTAAPLPQNSWKTVRYEFNGTQATHNIYQNGALLAKTDVTSNDLGMGSVSATFQIGARVGLVARFTGVYASCLVVSPYPDAAFIAYVDNYFANRYAIPLA